MRLHTILSVIIGAACVVFALVQPSRAVSPDEFLKDDRLEARARALSAELRCVVCQNQSIDDSDAPLAKDLRRLVRDRLQAGDSDDEVKAYLVARYGTFVLLKPPFNWKTLLLWVLPFIIVVLATVAVYRGLFRPSAARQATTVPTSDLTDDEQRRLEMVLEQDTQGQTDD